MSATYRDALRAALPYLVLSVAWFQFSGYLLNRFFDSSPDLLRWQLINGYAWVAFSAGLIFIARARLFRCLGVGAKLRERNADRERLRRAAAAFDCTREGVLVTNSYSSLLRLKRLPVQKLKIDQGFVAGLPGDEDDAAIARVIIALAQSMGMQVHAEGIEQVEQASFLFEHDCDLGQGYWFGRPVPAASLDWARAPTIG
ncbi:EAL domain-containing protein [Pseudomonas sp. NPDC089918]|uniref:EAL domain-containing protein n=1 Tax=Pseudomonas sp. NPDC089918 TaxID=3390654 RepID=UPI003D059CA3